MEQFMTALYNLVSSWQGVVKLLLFIVLFGCGIMMIIPKREIREFAKEHLVWVVIGAGVCLAALVFAEEISAAFVF